MAGSNKIRNIKQAEKPIGKKIQQEENPDKIYDYSPAWCFAGADQEKWPFSEEQIGEKFWSEIYPRLRNLESQKWKEILVKNKKYNHEINVEKLNKVAQDRLAERHIEAEALISLRVTGSHRLYGYLTGYAFNILWFDDDHGDNQRCVCRSKKKHT